jgi:blue copper oxidase
MIYPHEKGWKDTVLVGPKEKVKVIITFLQKGEFVFHCHNLEHEDDGMMLNFEVK